MRTLVKATLIAGSVAVALGLGTAAAVAATGDGGRDDSPRTVQPSGTPSPVLEDRIPRPTPSDLPTVVPVPASDDHGVDDPATHDVADDRGVDDPATHDVADDHGVDDPATHDVGDDHGAAGHDAGDDHG